LDGPPRRSDAVSSPYRRLRRARDASSANWASMDSTGGSGGAWCGICDNIPSSVLGMATGRESRKAARACACASTSAEHSAHRDRWCAARR
jgi:hypothetical protein